MVSLIIRLCNISSKITWISTLSSGEKRGLFALCFVGMSFSNSILSPLTICNINLSDVSFCHSWICSAICPPWKFWGVCFKLTSDVGINISCGLLLCSSRTFLGGSPSLDLKKTALSNILHDLLNICYYTLIGSSPHFFSIYLSLLDLSHALSDRSQTIIL